VQQLHVGALRNPNSRRFSELGPDTGFDTIGDPPMAGLARFLDLLERERCLPKTVLYNLNPAANELCAALCGSFQDGVVPGKIQLGSAWWFQDQPEGMERQLRALASIGVLARFVGMVTDSRSFLSYPRHELFRRTLCKFLGELVATGEVPDDPGLLDALVRDVCYTNAATYFALPPR
jgi:glucuronate isomerase